MRLYSTRPIAKIRKDQKVCEGLVRIIIDHGAEKHHEQIKDAEAVLLSIRNEEAFHRGRKRDLSAKQ